ncbi:MAG: DUF493 domain-containing protein [Gammaproteobacteria bacterium]|nr:MAG: DUF493 domain-containing protein [Gammaproteobacteria bacterium]
MNKKETLLKFPCDFTIKAIGFNCSNYVIKTTNLIKIYAPELQSSNITTNYSKQDKYCSLSFKIKAKSKQQLDHIYQELSDNENVLMAL